MIGPSNRRGRTSPRRDLLKVPSFASCRTASRLEIRKTPEIGVHSYVTSCTARDEPGLHQVTGKVEVVPYKGDNPLYRHGQIRVARDRRHFEYADGTPFFWLGDTWWRGDRGHPRFPGGRKWVALPLFRSLENAECGMRNAEWGNGGWQMADGGWQMTDGKWQMADDTGRMADDGWQMTDGGWRMADDGCEARSGGCGDGESGESAVCSGSRTDCRLLH